MDLQFHGANCLTINTKQGRITVDDDLEELGSHSVTKADDIVIFTQEHGQPKQAVKLIIDGPGEYEVSGVSIQGIATRAHIDEDGKKNSTLYTLVIDDIKLLITGHIYPELSDEQLETIGTVDILCIPVGGNGYTLDSIGALKLLKKIEPKVVIPTHYADSSLKYPVPQQSLEEALKGLAMDPKERLAKLKIKPADLLNTTSQLIVLENS
jgi:L-ascorbate metabolism protein UlaG (beta-lactamase superfamily)